MWFYNNLHILVQFIILSENRPKVKSPPHGAGRLITQVIINLLCRLSVLAVIAAIVGPAGRADAMRETGSAALGAGQDTGILQLPDVAASLIATSLGHFCLWDCHTL